MGAVWRKKESQGLRACHRGPRETNGNFTFTRSVARQRGIRIMTIELF